MNRIIKFRVWDKKFRGKKKMCYPDKTGFLMIRGVNPDLRDLMMMGTHYNDRLIFQQYTGLNDKNGKEIYEGDIVESSKAACANHYHRKTYVSHVIFGYGKFYAGVTVGLGDTENLLLYKDIVVIGNIFETPDLLKS